MKYSIWFYTWKKYIERKLRYCYCTIYFYTFLKGFDSVLNKTFYFLLWAKGYGQAYQALWDLYSKIKSQSCNQCHLIIVPKIQFDSRYIYLQKNTSNEWIIMVCAICKVSINLGQRWGTDQKTEERGALQARIRTIQHKQRPRLASKRITMVWIMDRSEWCLSSTDGCTHENPKACIIVLLIRSKAN